MVLFFRSKAKKKKSTNQRLLERQKIQNSPLTHAILYRLEKTFAENGELWQSLSSGKNYRIKVNANNEYVWARLVNNKFEIISDTILWKYEDCGYSSLNNNMAYEINRLIQEKLNSISTLKKDIEDYYSKL